MIVLCESYGNHSNRLFQSLHYEAFCLEHDIPFYNPTFSDLIKLYPGVTAHPAHIFGRPLHALQRAKLLDKLLTVNFPETEDDLLNICGRNVTFVGGWKFRVSKLTKKHWDVLAPRYAVTDLTDAEKSIEQAISRWRNEGHLVTGVHIRRGDYKTWESGIYYFDDATYQSYMDQVTELAKQQGKKACFVIFSNEAVQFEPAENLIISRCRWHVDHHIMKNCTFLLGPPSTFTLWASYTGRTKYLHLKSRDEKLDLAKFSICDG